MPIQIGDGFKLRGKQYIDDRQEYNSISDMVAMEENTIPEGFIVYVKENKKYYTFDSTNIVDPVLAKWREFKTNSAEQGEENIIEQIRVNGDALPVDSNKAVDISVPEIAEYTLEEIKDMIGLTTEQIVTLQTLIDDGVIQLSKTFSSSKIYQSIQDAIATANLYTDNEMAKKITGSYVVVENINEITSDQYIYLLKNEDKYDVYILISNIPTKIGDTSIDLSQYLTIEEAEATYLKIADAQGIYATIESLDGIVADVVADAVDDKIKNLFDIFYPVGTIYHTLLEGFDPNVSFGGTWKLMTDRFLLGAGNTYYCGEAAGSDTVRISVDNLPPHYHTVHGCTWNWGIPQQPELISINETVRAGMSSAGNALSALQNVYHFTKTDVNGELGQTDMYIMPPYIAVYMWKRTR